MTDGTRPRTRRPVVAMAPGSDRVLAAEMLLPLDRESRRVIIPGDRYGLRWSPYTVELFGLTRTDDATSPSPTGVLYVQRADDEALAPRPANWPSLETAYGHIHARRRLDPATLVLEVWQQIVRCRGCSSFLEWRFRAEAFDQLSLRGLQREERLSDAHKVLRGRALIRREPLGRPSGSQLTEDELWERGARHRRPAAAGRRSRQLQDSRPGAEHVRISAQAGGHEARDRLEGTHEAPQETSPLRDVLTLIAVSTQRHGRHCYNGRRTRPGARPPASSDRAARQCRSRRPGRRLEPKSRIGYRGDGPPAVPDGRTLR